MVQWKSCKGSDRYTYKSVYEELRFTQAQVFSEESKHWGKNNSTKLIIKIVVGNIAEILDERVYH